MGAFVVRIDAPDEALLEIDRTSELANCEAASGRAWARPSSRGCPHMGVLVTRFLEGRRLTPEDLRRGDRLPELAALLRRLHGSCRFRGGSTCSAGSATIRRSRWLADASCPRRYARTSAISARSSRAFVAHPVRPVACHNDLVAENLIDTPAGLRLIDYEYSGNNDPYSDLGDAWSESHLWLDQIEQLVGHYHGEPEPALVARARLWALVSQYGWTLWAVLRNHVAPDPDLMAWALGLYAEAVAEFESDEFEPLLEEVAATPRTLSR